jgi:methylglutaconyl-CoA hydratase
MAELLIENVGNLRLLTLNRPEKRNALNDGLVEELKAALREASSERSLSAILIRGAGKDFCSGADLSSLRKIADASFEENLDDARSLAELFSLIRATDVPVIAAVHGRALAGGCGLATSCDLVVSTRTATFGYPEVKIGFVPAIVMAFLRRNVSEKQAFEMATQGFEFTPEQALRVGLVNMVVDAEDPTDATIEYAAVYDKVSRSAVRLTKRLLYRMDGLAFEDALQAGAEVNAEARMTEDCKRGISRFLEK